MKKLSFFFLVLALTGTSAIVQAGDIHAGKEKAKVCAGCHGLNGISKNDLWPNLAGQKKAYLVKQLKDFKTGARKDTQMQYWAKTLSDKDMEDLAAYYNSLKP